ncbi:MAG TPA: dehydrogenase, partial [Gammaproteobacteria bacterium]|nr:dehydrogenase [Gammaproteobacteria bacterium]
YARTKRMQVVLAGLLGQRLTPPGIWTASTHPGWAATPGVTDSLPGFAKFMRPLLRSPQQGADTAIWLATSPEVLTQSGEFWHDRAIRPQHYLPYTKETAAQRECLWEYCVSQTASG